MSSIGVAGERYPEQERFRKQAELLGGMFWVGPYWLAGYDRVPTVGNVSAFDDRKDADGNPLRREMSGNRKPLTGEVFTFDASVSYRVAELVVREGWQEASRKIYETFVRPFVVTQLALGQGGYEVRTGAGGGVGVPALPLWLAAAHATGPYGEPNFHIHNLSNGVGFMPDGRSGALSSTLPAAASLRERDRSLQRLVAERARRHLGWDLEVNEHGKAFDPTVSYFMTKAMGQGRRREEIYAKVAEWGLEPKPHVTHWANQATKPDKPQTFSGEDLVKLWAPRLEEAQTIYTRETGLAYRRPVPEKQFAPDGTELWPDFVDR
jgi:hypothetical protein